MKKLFLGLALGFAILQAEPVSAMTIDCKLRPGCQECKKAGEPLGIECCNPLSQETCTVINKPALIVLPPPKPPKTTTTTTVPDSTK